jgi:hypothetical protein
LAIGHDQAKDDSVTPSAGQWKNAIRQHVVAQAAFLERSARRRIRQHCLSNIRSQTSGPVLALVHWITNRKCSGGTV